MNLSSRTLAEWLELLENRHDEEIQLGLSRIQVVAKRLDLLHFDAKLITVAGTNGKGSTIATLEAIYVAAGYQVASYTSPHLLVFNERIRVNQIPITDKKLSDAFVVIEEGRGDIHLTYFEMVTLAAFWVFKQLKLDVILLEVGLGGRLDATNIIDSDLAIITTIDFDHQAYLGHTKEAIGYEKAGILRENKPYIYADDAPPESVIEKGILLNAPRICYSFKTNSDSLQIRSSSGEVIEVSKPCINFKAATAAIMASAYLNSSLPVTNAEWNEAMQNVHISGRQQVVKGPITTIFDVAHNPQAVSLLADFIRSYQPKGKVHAVFAGLKDKDLCGLIRPMHFYVDFWYPTALSGKRAASGSMLLAAMKAENCSVSTCFNTPKAAYQAARQSANSDDLIVVYGSFLTVSAVMSTDNAA